MRKTILLFLIISLAYTSNAQWQQINSPYGPEFNKKVYCVGMHNNYIFAGTDNGIYISTNNGNNWTFFNFSMRVHALAFIGDNIFAGTSGSGVYRSSDFGNTWIAVNNGLPSYIDVRTFFVKGNNIYVGIHGDGVFLSTDNGNNWAAMNNGLPNNPGAYSIDTIGNEMIIGTLHGIYTSLNNGIDWDYLGLSNYSVRDIAIKGDTILAGTYNGLFASTNNGVNWVNVNIGTNDCVNAVEISDFNVLVGTCNEGLYLSSDFGGSWNVITNGLSSNNQITSIDLIGNSIFTSTDIGVFISASGISWSKLGSYYSSISSFAFKGNNIFAGTYGNGVFLSTDNGSSWNTLNSGLANLNVNCLLINSDSILAGTNGGVFLSSDNGNSWTELSNSLSNLKVLALAKCGNNFYAGTLNDGLFYSSDFGTNWSPVNDFWLPSDYSVYSLLSIGNNLFAGTSIGILFSANEVHNWTNVCSVCGNTTISSLAYNGSYIYAGTYYNGAFLSMDNGNNWSTANTGIPSSIPIKSISVSGNKIFAATDTGVCVSGNNGVNWNLENSGFFNSVYIFGTIANNGNDVFLGTYYQGIWKRPLMEMTTDELKNNDNDFIFYPNPSKNNVTIKVAQKAVIEMFNLQGQIIIKILADREQATIDITDFAKGLYYFKVTTDKGMITKKFIKE